MMNDKLNLRKVRSRLTKQDINTMMEAYPPYGVSPTVTLYAVKGGEEPEVIVMGKHSQLRAGSRAHIL